MRNPLRLVTCLSIAFAGLHCGGGSHPATTGSPGSGTVGTSGGTVATSDGTVQIAVPAGALPANVDVTLTPITPPDTAAVGTVYDIGPTGTQFTMPVTLTFSYGSVSLAGADPSTLRVATYAGGAWQLLPGASVDTSAKTVSGTTTHLSPYGLIFVSAGSVCAMLQSNPSTCTGSPASGSSGGTAPDCPAAPTCETATGVCAGYPGATVQDCSDSANGYSASCCFAPGAPICFAIANDVTCAGSTGTSGGPAGGGTAPPQPDCPASPTCASATAACANYPGATLQNCVDGTSGYTGSCCFAPAAPVCVMVSAASGGSTCTSGPSGGSSCPPPPAPPRCADGNPCAGVAGSTMKSCTDTSDGYQAACCLPVGVLPSTGSSSSGSTGGTDAGIHTGGGSPDAGAGAPPPNDAGGGTKPPQPDAGGQPPPPPPSDAGGTKPPQPDAGGTKPPRPDGSSQPPPPSDAGGTKPPQPDAGSQPPPPTDSGSAGSCMLKMMPSDGQGAPCGVSESCSGGVYRVQCDAVSGECMCMSQAGATSAPGTFSCANFNAVGALAACGFPPGS